VNRKLLFLFLFAPVAFSQPRLEMGVRIDTPLVGPLTKYSNLELCGTDAQCGTYQSAPPHPAIGLSASVPIAPRLRLRFDPVYQRVGISATSYIDEYQSGPNSPLGEAVNKRSSTADRWQFPVLVEAELPRHFRFGVGPAVSLLTGINGVGKVVDPFTGISTYVDNTSFPVSRQAIAGAAAALEFPFRFGNVTVAPELRYKRWFDKHYGGNSTMDEFTGGVAIRFSR
jgi:hypothetical protein